MSLLAAAPVPRQLADDPDAWSVEGPWVAACALGTREVLLPLHALVAVEGEDAVVVLRLLGDPDGAAETIRNPGGASRWRAAIVRQLGRRALRHHALAALVPAVVVLVC